MAILDELLKRIKSNVLDKTTLDERIAKAVQPITRLPQQFNPSVNNSIANRYFRGTPGTILTKVQKAPQVATKRISDMFKTNVSGSPVNRFWQSKPAQALVNTQDFIKGKRDLYSEIDQLSNEAGKRLSNRSINDVLASRVKNPQIKTAIQNNPMFGLAGRTSPRKIANLLLGQARTGSMALTGLRDITQGSVGIGKALARKEP
jgi:hypothetical protein